MNAGELIRALGRIYHFHFRAERRERMFISSLSFVVLFGSLLSIAWWGGAFVRDVVKELSRVREVPGLARVAGAI